MCHEVEHVNLDEDRGLVRRSDLIKFDYILNASYFSSYWCNIGVLIDFCGNRNSTDNIEIIVEYRVR